MEELGKNPIIVTSPIVRMYFKKITSEQFRDLTFSSTAAVTSTDGFLKNLYKPRGTTSFVFIIVTLSPNSAFASAIKRAISNKYFPSNEMTSVVTLDPKIEQEIMGSVKQTEQGEYLLSSLPLQALQNSL